MNGGLRGEGRGPDRENAASQRRMVKALKSIITFKSGYVSMSGEKSVMIIGLGNIGNYALEFLGRPVGIEQGCQFGFAIWAWCQMKLERDKATVAFQFGVSEVSGKGGGRILCGSSPAALGAEEDPGVDGLAGDGSRH
jgi:hypothetical protein